MTFLNRLGQLPRSLRIFLGFAVIAALGLVDVLTGYEIAFSLFYVAPVSFLCWFGSRPLGLVASLASAVVWLLADVGSGHPYAHPLIPFWNTLIRLSFFGITVLLLAALKSAVEREAQLARTDSLTGAVNSRFFYELVRVEIDRFQRYGHPFSLAYIDLDNFKIVNDQSGHAAGDRVLRTTVEFIRGHTRRTDVVARLGGDEFAVLLPETDQDSARVAFTNMRAGLLEEMRQNQWPITFSVGVVTCRAAPPGVDALLGLADELMYSVKRRGKNAIDYSTVAVEGEGEGEAQRLP